MKSFLRNQAKIQLTPSPGWSWSGWDGKLTVYSLHKPLHLSEDNIIVESDVHLFTLISPRGYTAIGFENTPGLIATAIFTVNQHTLAEKIKVNNAAPLLITTTGKFTCNYSLASTKITPGGPVPDPVVLKSGTWKVVEPNQCVFYKNTNDEPCIDSKIAEMSHHEKMVTAIKQSNVGEAALETLGGAVGIAKSLGVGAAFGLGIAAIALLPFEAAAAAAAVVTTAVLAVGAALSGYEIGEGINNLVDFYKKTDAAKTCPEIGSASDSFSDGVAKIGIGGVSAALSVLGAKGNLMIPKRFNSVDEVSSLIENGRIKESLLKKYITRNTENKFIPSEDISEGYKYDLTLDNGDKVQLKWHSPDAKAKRNFPNANSGNQWTAQIKVKNKLLGTNGRLYNRPSEITHIPVDLNK